MLVNAFPTKEFTINKHIRKCDPSAPVLFNHSMEGLHGVMYTTLDKDILWGILSHLVLANVCGRCNVCW